jgi:hypothetical protein
LLPPPTPVGVLLPDPELALHAKDTNEQLRILMNPELPQDNRFMIVPS